ncbi:MAG: response regulator [Saccharospirillaceae bacterium]|nr:response regulator [Pseudomonadales bacterium]NRB77517.1 response regulator [Saccharospirillaceae bacterium]
MDINYHALSNALCLGITLIDSTNTIISWNSWLEQKSELDEKDVIGKKITSLFPHLENSRLALAINDCISQGHPSVISNVFIKSPLPLYSDSLHKHLIQQSITLLPIKSNNSYSCLMQVIDVTASSTKVEALEKQVVERKYAEQAKANFLANMSHEIRTPMNGVLGMLDLITHSPLTTQQAHYTHLAQSSAESLLNLINDILDFSKIDAGELNFESIDFNLHTLLDEIIEPMALKANECNLEVILDMSSITNSMIKGDPFRIRQILINLISNAIKFTETGSITVLLETEIINSEQLHLKGSVLDTGIGISPAQIENLFQSFSQADSSTTRKYGGTGLGLTIVKQLCNLMHGDLTVTSQEGKGSQFNFYFELEVSDEVIVLKPIENLSPYSFLIIDDNQIFQTSLQKQLTKWGAKCTLCNSAVSALQLLEKNNESLYDLVLIDQNMPKINGETFATLIREKNNFSHMILILMSPSLSEKDNFLNQEHNFNYIVDKPITATKLVNSINNTLFESQLIKIEPTIITKKVETVRKRLLLVEDNQINQYVAEALLDDLGYDTTICENGSVAIETLKQSHPNEFSLILMDCQMPVLDGYKTTEEIRKGAAGEKFNDINIIAMTANAMKGDREKCLNAGMNDYIAKPINRNEVIKTLNKWI